MRLTYFAADGSYGNANGMTIVDTEGWTADDWQVIEDCTDAERATLASELGGSQINITNIW